MDVLRFELRAGEWAYAPGEDDLAGRHACAVHIPAARGLSLSENKTTVDEAMALCCGLRGHLGGASAEWAVRMMKVNINQSQSSNHIIDHRILG